MSNSKNVNATAPALTESETNAAVQVMIDTSSLRFPRIIKRFSDPEILGQKYGNVTWVPAKGVKPNDRGIYGVFKLRGNYATEDEAKMAAAVILKNTDSYHKIHTVFVGQPKPLSNDEKYSKNVSKVDLKKDIKEIMNHSVKEKRASEKRKVKEIKDREQLLREDTGNDHIDPLDRYIELRVKKAQVAWTFLKNEEKLLEMKNIIIKARKQMVQLEKKHPTVRNKYLEKYKQAARDSGVIDSERKEDGFESAKQKDTFLKYIDQDIIDKLPF